MRHDLPRSIAIGLITAWLLSGCATTMRVGAPPRTDRLKGLTVGVSTAQEVRQALGEPRGSGMARGSAIQQPRRILYYEYMEAEGQRIGLTLLVVFLHEDRYDGHLWFSSAQIIQEAGR
jgi:hypothetical protein